MLLQAICRRIDSFLILYKSDRNGHSAIVQVMESNSCSIILIRNFHFHSFSFSQREILIKQQELYPCLIGFEVKWVKVETIAVFY